MSTYASQLEEEQRAVTRAYNRLDALRAETKQRLDVVGAAAVPTARPHSAPNGIHLATMYEDRLIQLRGVEDRLVFGRLDNAKNDRLYIGRIGLTDEQHTPMLIDWRAEAARPFYEATPSHHGDIVMRRHITLHLRDVVALEDEVLDIHSQSVDEASTSGTLTGEGALLSFAQFPSYSGQDDRYRRHDSRRAGRDHPFASQSCRSGAGRPGHG